MHVRKEAEGLHHPFLNHSKQLGPLDRRKPRCTANGFSNCVVGQQEGVLFCVKEESHPEQSFIGSKDQEIVVEVDLLDEDSEDGLDEF